ncbi:MAG: hypothetical protein SPG04_09970 [Candidatus Heritagella sp.]|nr:hypothetical protein [Candidatus Heritagella sp.]
MRNKAIDMNQPIFQPVKQAAKTTGLSEWFLRQALKNGTLPHIRTGTKVLVNVPRLLAELDEQSQPTHSLVNL